MSTTAITDGSDYALNGSKTFITNAGEADVYLVFAATDEGHSAFLVDRSTAGPLDRRRHPEAGDEGLQDRRGQVRGL